MIDKDVETTVQDVRVAIDLPDEQVVYMVLSLEMLRTWISDWINGAVASGTDPANNTPAKQMMRLSLNSALIAIGPFVAKMFWHGPGEPPKPGRKDDLMEWYVRFVAGQILYGIEHSTSMLHLEATEANREDNEDTASIRINAIHTRSAAGR